jgi:hypothetical protein
VWSTVAARVVTRVGVKPVLMIGFSALATGLAYLSQISVEGSYAVDLLPGFLVMAMGLGFSFVPISISALTGVEPAEAGVASGLINTSQQIGTALGIAALSTIATSRSEDALAHGSTPAAALVHGFHSSLYVAVGVAVVGIVAAATLVRSRPVASATVEQLPVREAAPALDLAA